MTCFEPGYLLAPEPFEVNIKLEQSVYYGSFHASFGASASAALPYATDAFIEDCSMR